MSEDVRSEEPRETEASARAAQIYAEMLGMVCHKEYIQYEQDQTVQLPLSFENPTDLCFRPS